VRGVDGEPEHHELGVAEAPQPHGVREVGAAGTGAEHRLHHPAVALDHRLGTGIFLGQPAVEVAVVGAAEQRGSEQGFESGIGTSGR
jgi:hypothetical protein